ncbi:hypothetical protein [Parasitella parasitica]|uniref:C2H2-type domain-containing protein n=1 Tax=Parasitella parasitica TaxID=35722 RepID=A0A0B7NHE4_9FUNG|nr:hypothetical protein [Parasitella parasitica]
MYSATYQSTFDLSSAASHLTTPDIEFDRCLNNYQRNDSIDYSRRPSYFTGLLGNPQSEASYSDHEQQTPSPFNSYEDYQHQQYHHPLDNSNKRRLSTLIELPHLSAASAANGNGAVYHHHPPSAPVDHLGYSNVVNPWLAAANASASTTTTSSAHNSPSRLSSPMIYANPAVDMYSPQSYFNHQNQPSFDQQQQQQYHPLCGPMSDNLIANGLFRERASSSSSLSSSSDSALSVSPPASRRASKANVKSPLKTTRSRGRRVSNSPSIAGQKVFTCKHDDCGKVFKRSEHLKRHVRSIHTLEKPFECPYQSCSKRFSRSDNLNQHIRIHRHTGKDKTNNNNSAVAAAASSAPSSRNNSFSNYMPTY